MSEKKLCPVEGCDMLVQTRYFCGKHLKEIKEATKIKKGEPCNSCDDGRMVKAGIRKLTQTWRCNLCGKKRSSKI